jgi:FtsP/CotA-like multicopper oxidase with cupredoxin domain
MKKLACFTLLLLLTGILAVAQNVPTCNSFDATGVPIYSTAGYPDTTGTTACTDFFGVANYANSPLPVGPVDISATGFTVMNGGSGYSTPTVTIDDFYATPGATGAGGCTATVTGGVITGITCTTAGSGYRAPVVTITDATGSGAMVLAKLASATSGGMRKFVSTDLLPDLKGTIPTADTATFSGSDFYVIGLVQYQTQMHADLPLTTVRGYCQLANSAATTCTPSYLGPVIVAQKNRPVRILFKNLLPPGSGGNLFIPADTTYMGMGNDPNGVAYTQNRAVVHLHGGATPWISDGTPHQWTVPEGESLTVPQRGPSVRFVPDMWFDAGGNLIASCAGQTTCAVSGATNDPGQGNLTYYWTNQQGGRLMFYHDHAYGTTRLNVYAGMAAGYLIVDPAEEDALAAATAPGTINSTSPDLAHLIPLVIQDKTFVPTADQLAGEDPTWTATPGGGTIFGSVNLGDLWLNHVYPPNQNPNDLSGANAFGRWDYGAWFFPPQNTLTAANPPTAITIPCTSAAFPNQLLAPTTANPVGGCPIIMNPSGTPESFMDTPVVNGKAYPVLHVAPEAYRFRILSVGNDRSLNLSLFLACGSGTFSVAATNCAAPGALGTEVPMVPAVQGGPGTTGYVYPDQLDGRLGGVPDSTAVGPAWVQIGSEGGVLPNVAVIPPTPIGYEYNRRSITVTNVSSHGLLLGPAERADAIVDFSAYSGKTLIMYNDSPAPIPAFDTRIDYFTGDPDQVQQGGAPTTLPGYGPNTRTIMQIVVDGTPTSTTTFNLTALQGALPGIFATSTAPLPAIVPEPTYPVASGGNSTTATYGRIQDNTITYTPVGTTSPTTYTYDQKAIQELFTLDYGRMNATLGVELPFTNFITQTTIPYGYVDWPTEILQDGQTQIWKLTHNGVDTHFIHFHLFNVQVINRIGWDGAVKPPDANELGWKETVRMNPLEDIVFALKPIKPDLPWPIPDSVRPNDVTAPTGQLDMAISGLDPASGNATITTVNQDVNFGWEYVWHCHILGHEENDMMRPIIFQAAPPAPSDLVVTNAVSPITGVVLTWIDHSASETGFTVQRAVNDPNFVAPQSIPVGASTPNTAFGGTITYNDPAPPAGTLYYRVQAFDDFSPASPLSAPWAPLVMTSGWSNTALIGALPNAGLNPTSLTFGSVLLLSTSGTQTATLSNSGAVPLGIISIGFTGLNPGDFLVVNTSTCGTSLAANSSCTIDVAFRPTALGLRAAVLTVNSNDPSHPTLGVSVTGTGIGPVAVLSPTVVPFGNQLVGTTSATNTLTLSNAGSAGSTLTINSIGLTGANPGDFAIAGNTCGASLTQNANCTITLTFKPTAIGARSAGLTVTSSDPVNPTVTSQLTGTGTAPVAVVSPTSLAFGNQKQQKTSTPLTVTLSNTGTAPLTINSIVIGGTNAGDFAISSNTCGASLAAGSNCTLNVTFRPAKKGARSATLTFTDNSNAIANSTQNVALSGTGQ